MQSKEGRHENVKKTRGEKKKLNEGMNNEGS